MIIVLLIWFTYAYAYLVSYVDECLDEYRDDRLRRLCIEANYYKNINEQLYDKLNDCYTEANQNNREHG